MSSPGSLDGFAALVTGGGTGIGLGCAAALAADGAMVTVCGRRADVLAAAAASLGPNGRWVQCDVTVEEQVAAAVAAAAEPLGRLDAVVTSAGGNDSGTIGPIVLTDVKAWERSFSLYVTGTLATIKHAAPMIARSGGGSIVAISSTAGRLSHRGMNRYAMCKAAVEMLVRGAADELRPFGVRVNAVRPGLVPTDMTSSAVGIGAVVQAYADQMPLERLGTPGDIGAAVRYLAGPESSWVTGTILDVDGGQHLRAGTDLDVVFQPMFGHAVERALRG